MKRLTVMSDEKRQFVYDFIRIFWGDDTYARHLREVCSKESDEAVNEMYKSILKYHEAHKKAKPVFEEILREAQVRGPITDEEIERFLTR